MRVSRIAAAVIVSALIGLLPDAAPAQDKIIGIGPL